LFLCSDLLQNLVLLKQVVCCINICVL
jgi:hypothetical protein